VVAVFVNGVAVWEKAKPTGATPGRFVPRQKQTG
jgi:predicted small integral membrane protein